MVNINKFYAKLFIFNFLNLRRFVVNNNVIRFHIKVDISKFIYKNINNFHIRLNNSHYLSTFFGITFYF